jgi:hypothetical protein
MRRQTGTPETKQDRSWLYLMEVAQLFSPYMAGQLVRVTVSFDSVLCGAFCYGDVCD